jgi:hypothetical protein
VVFVAVSWTSLQRTVIWAGGSFANMVALHWAASLRRGRVKGGFDLLCLVVLFALKMKFVDGVNGTFENGITNEAVDCRSPSNCCCFDNISSVNHLLL